jgi:glycosyltransferase involved in cell wall biosynthesis
MIICSSADPDVSVSMNLEDLPPSPPDRTGWPWTVESSRFPECMPDGSPWPKISVVTPSLNQGLFIEETIRSILLQRYPNLEYIVIDGGSRDQTIDIIHKYAPWLTYWVSEPDGGQPQAIMKGLGRATGEYFNFINSDDVLTPNALRVVAIAFPGVDVVAGGVRTSGDGRMSFDVRHHDLSARNMINGVLGLSVAQQAVWLRRAGVLQCGGIRPRFQYVFDCDLLIRYLMAFPRVAYVPDILAGFRLHPESKTCVSGARFNPEFIDLFTEMAAREEFKSVRKACHRFIRRLEWETDCRTLLAEGSLSSYYKAAKLAIRALRDPSVRCSRWTAGAIRRLLLPDGVSSAL